MYFTIYLYLTKLFTKTIIAFYAIFLSLIFLMQLPTNLKTNKTSSILDVLITTILQLPQFVIDVSPFIILFASFYCFKSLSNNKEIIIFKSIGLSVWKILSPFIIITVLLSLIILFVFSLVNIASINYLNLQKQAADTEGQIISIYNKDIWIVDKINNNNQTIILTNKLNKVDNNVVLGKAIVFNIENNQLINLINAQSATIKNDKLFLEKITLKNIANPTPVNLDSLVIDFKVKINKFNDFNLIPAQSYILSIPSIIKYLKQTGLNSLEFTVYFYNLLSLPIFMLTLLFISAYFAFSNNRVQNSILQIIATTVLGFLLYFSGNFFASLVYINVASPLVATILIQILFLLIIFNLLLFKEGV